MERLVWRDALSLLALLIGAIFAASFVLPAVHDLFYPIQGPLRVATSVVLLLWAAATLTRSRV